MTFSITAYDQASDAVGIAITTSSIAVGSRCPWVRAGVGAVATQNITDPTLGRKILDCMETGLDAQQALDQIVSSASFINYRQLTVVDTRGNAAHFTGEHILGCHAAASGLGCVAAGNLLADETIPSAMVESFLNRQPESHLAETLLNALRAGLDAGGEMGTVHSGALLVATKYEWPEVNLRVDWHDSDPVGELLKLWDAYKLECDDYVLRAVQPDAAPSFGVPGDP